MKFWVQKAQSLRGDTVIVGLVLVVVVEVVVLVVVVGSRGRVLVRVVEVRGSRGSGSSRGSSTTVDPPQGLAFSHP